jgi:hypothetical protein
VFGWTKIKTDGTLRIPDKAFEEYGFKADESLIMMSGSKRSGGFGLTSLRLLKGSAIEEAVKNIVQLHDFSIPPGKVMRTGNRSFTWLEKPEGRCINLPEHTIKEFSLEIKNKILVARGSGLALGFVTRGPIYSEALTHPELKIFK